MIHYAAGSMCRAIIYASIGLAINQLNFREGIKCFVINVEFKWRKVRGFAINAVHMRRPRNNHNQRNMEMNYNVTVPFEDILWEINGRIVQNSRLALSVGTGPPLILTKR